MSKHVIRTSDRNLFKRCRQQWNFNSKIRHHYEPARTPQALAFGTDIHTSIEAYFNDEDPIHRMRQEMDERLAADPYCDDPLIINEYEERKELAEGMLNYFDVWVQENFELSVIDTEVEFEVPVDVPEDVSPPGDFHNENGMLYLRGDPVVYQGRIDAIALDKEGNTYIVDWKTTSQFGPVEWLDIDTQVSSYAWAYSRMGNPVNGVYYVQLRKSFPKPPRMLKGGSLSKDKSQKTTYALYVEEIERSGFNPADYADILSYLADQEDQFIRAIPLKRSREILDSQAQMIYAEAIDMLGNPMIYPNSSSTNCNYCPFKAPCLAVIEQRDAYELLNDPSLFTKGD